MKMTKELNKLFNEQIKLEYDSAFLYLAMSEWLEQNDWADRKSTRLNSSH